MSDRTPGIDAPGEGTTGWDQSAEDTRVQGDMVPTELDSGGKNQTSTHYDSTTGDTRVRGGAAPKDILGAPEGRQTTGYESQ